MQETWMHEFSTKILTCRQLTWANVHQLFSEPPVRNLRISTTCLDFSCSSENSQQCGENVRDPRVRFSAQSDSRTTTGIVMDTNDSPTIAMGKANDLSHLRSLTLRMDPKGSDYCVKKRKNCSTKNNQVKRSLKITPEPIQTGTQL